MTELINKLFKEENIEYFGILSVKNSKIVNKNLFERKTFFAKSIITFLVPYYTGETVNGNISLYAMSRDYHLYIKEVTDRIIKELKTAFPKEEFTGMGDHSPIDEVNAAAITGLGIIGDNRCLINEKYGSFVFIGEIFTSMELEQNISQIKFCGHCNLCKESCPSPDACLSHLTQQKGELDEKTVELMRKYNTAWGCDICQKVCILNRNAEKTPIEFFYQNRTEALTPKIIDEMSDKELESRAYGWRKRKTIKRNINILFE
ncbi:MAG: epoxyqueuosine reductase [Clostridia bacterium]|nr:epoxyqueuosine reductase [Clostridia bacterium]